MADTEKTAAAATNPADVAQTEHSADVKTDAKAATTEPEAAANGDQAGKFNFPGHQSWVIKGSADNKNDRNDRRNNRGRGGFQNRNKNTQYVSKLPFVIGPYQHLLTRRNREFDNLPESDDPVEIRNQVCINLRSACSRY